MSWVPLFILLELDATMITFLDKQSGILGWHHEVLGSRGARRLIVCANCKYFMIGSVPNKLAARACSSDISSLSIDVKLKTARLYRLFERSHTTLKNSLVFFGLSRGAEGMNKSAMLQVVPI